MKRMILNFSSYYSQTTAAIALLFALMAPVIITSAGLALDVSQAYLVQQRLSQALDAAALAGAASSADADVIEQKVKDFFDANYPEDRLGVVFEPVVTVDGDEVSVSGTAQFRTRFLKLINVDTIDLHADTIVQRDVQGIEVALVLDTTGSMDSYDDDGRRGNAVIISEHDNIYALKQAATNFINIMFDSASRAEYVRIGLVPYSNAVNVGRYGLGDKPDGSAYDGDAFITLPSGVTYTTNHNATSGWYGCVVEHKGANYNSAATHVANSRGQLWSTATGSNSTKCSSSATCRGHGWAPNSSTNDPDPYDIYPDVAGGEEEYEGPWDIYQYGRVIAKDAKCSDLGTGYSNSRCSDCTGSSSKCNSTYCYCQYEAPNESCPYAHITPITSDRDYLLEQVETSDSNDMFPHGNTLGNIGMLWGARLISPEPPFEEGMPWDSEYWKKAIVMMTDGDNTRNGTYSSFWFANKNGLDKDDYDDRFEETCANLKKQNVLIYTVVFSPDGEEVDTTTKERYEDCASSEDQYIEADDQEALIDAFEQIARELSNLHIKG
jgi:Flp pilus assembly protein TadG